MEHNLSKQTRMPNDIHIRLHQHTIQIGYAHAYYQFDRTGRFLFVSSPNHTIRRGLDHRMVEVTLNRNNRSLRTYRDLTHSEKLELLEDVYSIVKLALCKDISPACKTWLESILLWEQIDLSSDKQAFQRAYPHPVSILPPDHYRSIVVQITDGCSYNRCLFCDFYRDRPFHIKTLEELDDHLMHIQDFLGERLQARPCVFLGDGNALVVPTERLLEMLQQIRRVFGSSVESFSTFMDTFHTQQKSQSEYMLLRNASLTTIYFGLETGLDSLRKILKKPGSANEVINSIKHVKSSGFHVAVIVIVGIGGHTYAEEHLKDTVSTILQMPLDHEDTIFLSPFVVPDNQAYQHSALALDQLPFSDEELLEEMKRWRSHLLAGPTKAKISLYSVQQHLY